jgi:hypothetical protein
MKKSASKVTLLTATSGPIFRGKYHTLETQCAYLQKYMPRGGRKMDSLTPDTIRRWRRVGVRRTKNDDNLHKFCGAVRSLLRLIQSADDIAIAIQDDLVSEYDFAQMIGLPKIDADFILAQHGFIHGIFFPADAKLNATDNLGSDRKDDAFGIYIVERLQDGHKSSIPECVLVIYRYIEAEREQRGVVFVKMFVPKVGALTQLAEYSGFMLKANNYRYFFFQSLDEFQDFVSIITYVGGVPLQTAEGIYVSVNIEGNPSPSHRKIIIYRKERNVTDALIEQYKRRLIPS